MIDDDNRLRDGTMNASVRRTHTLFSCLLISSKNDILTLIGLLCNMAICILRRIKHHSSIYCYTIPETDLCSLCSVLIDDNFF